MTVIIALVMAVMVGAFVGWMGGPLWAAYGFGSVVYFQWTVAHD